MSHSRLGDYILLRKIATGGMADVHLALKQGPEGFDRLVALKTILRHRRTHTGFRRMFINEARLAARFNHPNLINVFDVEAIDGSLSMTMEYVPGPTISELVLRGVEQGTPIERPHALRIILDACHGLYHAHRLQDIDGSPLAVVHRDVSPQNILVGYNGQVKVFDFGIAHANSVKDEALSGVLAGKYAYMSPEQCHGTELDERSDLFSLGIILWELTTQKRLFRRENQIKVLQAVTEEEVPKPSSVVEGYPKALEPVVMAALERDPANRPATALAFYDALKDYATHAEEHISNEHLSEYVSTVYADELDAERSFMWTTLPPLLEGERVDPTATGDDLLVFELDEVADDEAELSTKSDATTDTTTESSDGGNGSAAANDGSDNGRREAAEGAHSQLSDASDDERVKPTEPPAETGEDAPGLADLAVAGASPPTTEAVDSANAAFSPTFDAAMPGQLRRAKTLNLALSFALFVAIAGGLGGVLLTLGGTANGSTEPVVQSAVSITTIPPGATVFVDGAERTELTPTRVPLTIDSDVEVRVELSGHESVTTQVQTNELMPLTSLIVSLPQLLEEITGALTIVTEPPGAVLLVDGVPYGTTPATVSQLALGVPHQVSVSLAGHDSQTDSLTLTNTETRELRMTLPRSVLMGLLSIHSTPEGASIRIDGVESGVTPLQQVPLIAGRTFRIELSLDGYRVVETDVEIETGVEAQLSEVLRRIRRRDSREDRDQAPDDINPDETPAEDENGSSPYEMIR